MIKIQFNSDEEKENIKKEQFSKNFLLIEEQYLFEGNFLIFSDVAPEKEIVYVNVPQEGFESIKSDVTEAAETTATVLEDTTVIAETTASLVEDNTDTAETLAQALIEIDNLKAEITALKGV